MSLKPAARRAAESISEAVDEVIRRGRELVEALTDEGVPVTAGVFWRAVARRTLRPAEVEAASEPDDDDEGGA